jgi:hypothetical protein
VASLAFLVWLADRGQHDHVTVRLDDLLTGGALYRALEEDWTCRVLADKDGLARRRSKRAVKHTRDVIDVIKENRTRDKVLASLGMAEGTG